MQYTIEVTTADERLAGTDADVHVCLRGSAGSTGRLALRHAAAAACNGDAPHRDWFERGQTDTFVESGADVGTVAALNVAHNSKGARIALLCGMAV